MASRYQQLAAHRGNCDRTVLYSSTGDEYFILSHKVKILSDDSRYSYQGKFLCSRIMDFGNGKHNIVNNAATFKVLLPTSVAV